MRVVVIMRDNPLPRPGAIALRQCVVWIDGIAFACHVASKVIAERRDRHDFAEPHFLLQDKAALVIVAVGGQHPVSLILCCQG